MRDRLQTVGLAITVVSVLVLLGSLAMGLREGKETVAEAGPATGAAPGRERVRVEVLNGAGIPGLARAATHELRRDGFDVVQYGNAGGAHRDRSEVLDRGVAEGAAEEVAKALGIERVRSEPDTTLYLDVTVILGSDWEGRSRLHPALLPADTAPR